MNTTTQQEEQEPPKRSTLPIQQNNPHDVVLLHDVMQGITETAEEELDKLDSSDFAYSPQAFTSFKKQVSRFVTDLANESVRQARKNNADNVSRSHVERASEHLVTGSSKKKARYAGVIGGIFLGAAFGQFLSMTNTTPDKWSLTPTLIAAALLFVGAFLVAYQLANE